MTYRRRIAFPALVLCGAMAVGASAVALAAENSSAKNVKRHSAPALAAHYTIFRFARVSHKPLARHARLGSATTDTRLASVIARLGARAQARPGEQNLGLAASQAVTVAVTPTVSMTAVPGSGGACFVAAIPSAAYAVPNVAGFAIACGTTTQIDAHGISVTLGGASGSEYVWGVVPNGNSTVELTTNDGSTSTVPVDDNFYASKTSEPVASLTFRNDAGTITTRTLG